MGILPLPKLGSFVSISDAGTCKLCENNNGEMVSGFTTSK